MLYSFLYSQYLAYYLAYSRCSGNVCGVIELKTARHLEFNARQGNHAQSDRVLGLQISGDTNLVLRSL